MIHIQKVIINKIPVLDVFQSEHTNRPLPTVVYYHGYNGEKESSLTIAYKLAEKGMRVILPDSHLHGERKESLSQIELDLLFWEIVIQNIKEFEQITEYLIEQKLTIPNRIGVGGTSMGGITTFGALKNYEWINSAAVLMGSPKMTEYASMLIEQFNDANEEKISKEESEEALAKLKPYDISLQPELLNNRPLFIWHGEEDQVVPFEYSKAFYKEIKQMYDIPNKLKFLNEEGRAHHISRLSIAETAAWFHSHL